MSRLVVFAWIALVSMQIRAAAENPAKVRLEVLGVTVDVSSLRPDDRPASSQVETVGSTRVDSVSFSSPANVLTEIRLWRVPGVSCAEWAVQNQAMSRAPVKPFPAGWQAPLVERASLNGDSAANMGSCINVATTVGSVVLVQFPRVRNSTLQLDATATEKFLAILAEQMAPESVAAARGETRLRIAGATVKIPAGWVYETIEMRGQPIDSLKRGDALATTVLLNRYRSTTCATWASSMQGSPLKPGKIPDLLSGSWNAALFTRDGATLSEVDACREVGTAIVLATVTLKAPLDKLDVRGVRELLDVVGQATK